MLQELIKLWQLLNYLCGKRLVAIMPELLANLANLANCAWLRPPRNLSATSAGGFLDRLLKPERRKHELRSRAHTKPGDYIKHQIPIRPLRSGISNSLVLWRWI